MGWFIITLFFSWRKSFLVCHLNSKESSIHYLNLGCLFNKYQNKNLAKRRESSKLLKNSQLPALQPRNPMGFLKTLMREKTVHTMKNMSLNRFIVFYQLFWTLACPEGIGTNGTYPYPIPQPVKVGHTTGVYDPHSFRIVVWVLLRPTKTDQWKWCEMGPYSKRLESLTICRCHYKGSNFFSVI